LARRKVFNIKEENQGTRATPRELQQRRKQKVRQKSMAVFKIRR